MAISAGCLPTILGALGVTSLRIFMAWRSASAVG
jgi:hypothetical protein